MLASLASKVAGALPGILGAVVSWLFKTASVAVSWLAQNLWALILALGGLVYMAAVEYIRKSGSHHHKSSSANNKSHKD